MMKNQDNKAKCKARSKNCKKIRKHLIVSLEKYNIYQNLLFRLIAFGFTLNITPDKLLRFISFDLILLYNIEKLKL